MLEQYRQFKEDTQAEKGVCRSSRARVPADKLVRQLKWAELEKLRAASVRR